jgi:hypothetical protein
MDSLKLKKDLRSCVATSIELLLAVRAANMEYLRMKVKIENAQCAPSADDDVKKKCISVINSLNKKLKKKLKMKEIKKLKVVNKLIKYKICKKKRNLKRSRRRRN